MKEWNYQLPATFPNSFLESHWIQNLWWHSDPTSISWLCTWCSHLVMEKHCGDAMQRSIGTERSAAVECRSSLCHCPGNNKYSWNINVTAHFSHRTLQLRFNLHTHRREWAQVTHTHTHARTRTRTHTRTHTHAHTHTRAHTHARTHTHAHTPTHAHLRTHAHIHYIVCACARMLVCVHACV